MLFILFDNWKTLVFIKVYCKVEVLFNPYDLVFFGTNDLKEVAILFFISKILIPKLKYNANTKVPK